MKIRESQGADPRWSAESYAARQAVRLTSLGIIAETCPRSAATVGVAPTLGVVFGMGVGLSKGDPINGIVSLCQTAGAAMTLVKFGVFDPRGVLVAVSAESSAQFLSTGPKPINMLSRFIIPEDEMYTPALICTGGTAPTLLQAQGAVNGFGALTPGGATDLVTLAGQTDLTSPMTLVGAAAARAFYLAVY